MGKIVKIFDYLFLVRPVLFYPIWTIFLAGFIIARQQENLQFVPLWKSIQGSLTLPLFWAFFISLTFLMGAVFIINQFTDIYTDQVNEKLFLIANGLVSKSISIFEVAIFILVAFLISFLTDIQLMLMLLLLFLITGVAYSLPPLLWKDRPHAGLLVNLLGGMLTFLIGWKTVGVLSLAAFLHSLPYVFAIGAVYFLTTIADMHGDEKASKITFAVRYGSHATVRAGIIFEIICIVTAVWQRDWLILAPALLTFFFFIRLLRNDRLTAVIQATHYPILLLSLAVAVYFPFYFLLMTGIFFLSRWYYKRRFQLRYPSLSPIGEDK